MLSLACVVLDFEEATCSCVQPSAQQMPSIAFNDANTSNIRTAANRRTCRLYAPLEALFDTTDAGRASKPYPWRPVRRLQQRPPAPNRVARPREPAIAERARHRQGSVNTPRALSGASAVINCAGPFIDTAAPLIDAALRSGIHYLDVAAEQAAVLAVFEQFADAAREAAVVVAPAMAFYGGLSDLLATAAMGDWNAVDEICIAIALDGWKPTPGTRLTGQRNPGKRFAFSNGKLECTDSPPPRAWNFPAPFGMQDVVGLSFAETITISRHLQTPEIRAYMNLAPIKDIRDPSTPGPSAADESGRSSQIFVVDVLVRRGNESRRATVRGRDIYAITAPIVVEATQRVVSGLARITGVAAAGEIFDARDFMRSLCPAHLALEIQ